jgi:hypothetical protein
VQSFREIGEQMKVYQGNTTGGFDFQQPDPGTYLARCVRVIDLGTQTKTFQNESKDVHQIMIGWELPTERVPHGEFQGEPFVVYGWYTLSIHPKAKLRHDLVGWRGREFTDEELEGFELKNILGVPATLTLTMNKSGQGVNVTTVGGVPKGSKVAKQINPSVLFSLEPEEFSEDILLTLGKRIQEKIRNSPEYLRLVEQEEPAPQTEVTEEDLDVEYGVDEGDDGIPFSTPF